MITILYRPNSEHDTLVMDYLRDFEKQGHGKVDLMSIDTIAGDGLCKTYSVTSYPAILARRQNGELLDMWQGVPLPLINEVAYYNNL